MTVHFIGAGPGAADLLTLRGAELLRTSPVCLYAGTYIEQVLAHCPEDGERIDTQHLNLDAITEHLVRAHREGKDVARLCSGDPSIYSAIAEQTRRLDEAGFPGTSHLEYRPMLQRPLWSGRNSQSRRWPRR